MSDTLRATSAAEEFTRLTNGYRISQAIHVAAILGIAELLNDGPRTSDDLARATGTHARSLYRLLRALASVGVLYEGDECLFSLTPVGESMRHEAGGAWAVHIGRPYFWQTWGTLLHSVRTGEIAFEHLHGTDVWSYRARHPEDAAIFDAAMTASSRESADAVVGAYDFARFGRIVDVAGGQGALLAAILRRNPGTSGVLFDQPHVVAGAGAVLGAAGVADRCEVVGGDMFACVPVGADAYALRHILHDWNDERCVAILRVVRQAIGDRGVLLIIEQLIGPPNEAPGAKFGDLNMLVSPGGQERTRDEFADLFREAGFQLTRVVTTASPTCVIEGVPA